MTDKYISSMVARIKNYIDERDFYLAGSKFMELARYGIMVENDLLVTVCTELSDIFRNSIEEYDRYKKYVKESDLEKILENTDILLSYLNKDYESLSEEEKIKLLGLIVETTPIAERIQYNLRDYLYIERIRRRGDVL